MSQLTEETAKKLLRKLEAMERALPFLSGKAQLARMREHEQKEKEAFKASAMKAYEISCKVFGDK